MINIGQKVRNLKKGCCACSQFKSFDSFHRSTGTLTGLQGRCKDCVRHNRVRPVKNPSPTKEQLFKKIGIYKEALTKMLHMDLSPSRAALDMYDMASKAIRKGDEV